jgi:hypothetical protein
MRYGNRLLALGGRGAVAPRPWIDASLHHGGRFEEDFGVTSAQLKMDIEGAEVEVLRRLIETGALDKVDVLFVETHEKKMPWLEPVTTKLKNEIRAHPTCRVRFDWV